MSKRIKEAREEIGMSRAEMAREFGMPIRTLEKWKWNCQKDGVLQRQLLVTC